MRRLALLCLAAAVSGYNLVLQDFTLTGGLVANEIIRCGDNIDQLHVDGYSYNFDCYNVTAPTEGDPIDSIHIVYKGPTLTGKAKNINCDITTRDGDKIEFTLQPDMNTGKMLTSKSINGKYTPVAVPTTVAPPTTPLDCGAKANRGNDKDCPDFCADSAPAENKITPACCDEVADDGKTCKPAAVGGVKLLVKPKKIFKPAQKPEDAPKPEPKPAAPFAAVDSELPAAVRIRGPGPVIRDSPEDTVVDEDEERRVKRAAEDDDPPKVDDTTVSVVVTYYVLDEAGNPAAVWAAVIEGIILLVLVGLCFWFFFWSPRARTAATTAVDPYKPPTTASRTLTRATITRTASVSTHSRTNQPHRLGPPTPLTWMITLPTTSERWPDPQQQLRPRQSTPPLPLPPSNPVTSASTVPVS